MLVGEPTPEDIRELQRLFPGAFAEQQNFFIAVGKQGRFVGLRRASTTQSQITHFDFRTGQVVPIANNIEMTSNLEAIGRDALHSIQIESDVIMRVRLLFGAKDFGWIPIGPRPTRFFGVTFDAVEVEDVGMGPVLRMVAGTSVIAPLQTESHTLFVDRWGEITTSVAAFTDSDEGTGDDVVEFRPVVTRTKVTAGFGALRLHVSHIASHLWIVENTGSNTVLVRVRFGVVEGEAFITDETATRDAGEPLAAGAKKFFPSYIQAHRFIVQVIAAASGSNSTVEIQYHGAPVGSMMTTRVSDKVGTGARTNVTASGNTTLVTPAAGTRVRLKAFMFVNNGASVVQAGLRFGATGTIFFFGDVAADGGARAMNLIDAYLEGAVDELLIANLSAAGDVDFTVITQAI